MPGEHHSISIGLLLLIRFLKHSQEASAFLKRRATLEEEYGRGMQKLAKQSSEVYATNDGKAGWVINF